ncbi:hypothetical protein Psta_1467 [Pirellula staleyi DSM 6068]|uniref:Uncharacterized protein n=1 Tax=Pirellula staleyi (strain ATCC 27377 / DSM 6068 / ICPB 4128) TaxID=530564 RepID=D2QXF7_PIRSD|nr:hypothetical protein [Pirellula staleyi]ADB16142.1 hypothetical protein Psta_1467 [Pirellula staleyi DSM 6068]
MSSFGDRRSERDAGLRRLVDDLQLADAGSRALQSVAAEQGGSLLSIELSGDAVGTLRELLANSAAAALYLAHGRLLLAEHTPGQGRTLELYCSAAGTPLDLLFLEWSRAARAPYLGVVALQPAAVRSAEAPSPPAAAPPTPEASYQLALDTARLPQPLASGEFRVLGRSSDRSIGVSTLASASDPPVLVVIVELEDQATGVQWNLPLVLEPREAPTAAAQTAATGNATERSLLEGWFYVDQPAAREASKTLTLSILIRPAAADELARLSPAQVATLLGYSWMLAIPLERSNPPSTLGWQASLLEIDLADLAAKQQLVVAVRYLPAHETLTLAEGGSDGV